MILLLKCIGIGFRIKKKFIGISFTTKWNGNDFTVKMR